MNVLSLFSGSGAHDLGLERAGMRTVAFCESDPWCRAVLAKHWPGVPCFPDVRRLSGSDVPGPVDLVTGGFPCQDISVAGKGEGLGGERSGLWFEYLRIVSELRPSWVLAENVPALRSRGFDVVAAGLEAEGYAVWPVVVGAWAVGAPHRRERVWIVARRLADADCKRVADADESRRAGRQDWKDSAPAVGLRAPGVGDADGPGLAVNGSEPGDARSERAAAVGAGGEGGQRGPEESAAPLTGSRLWPAGRGAEQFGWEAPRLIEPGLGRATPGTPRGLDGFARRSRLRALGNANVPHVPEAIGRWILSQH